MLSPEKNGWHFAHDIFICDLLKQSVFILIQSAPMFVARVPIDNISALFHEKIFFHEKAW